MVSKPEQTIYVSNDMQTETDFHASGFKAGQIAPSMGNDCEL